MTHGNCLGEREHLACPNDARALQAFCCQRNSRRIVTCPVSAPQCSLGQCTSQERSLGALCAEHESSHPAPADIPEEGPPGTSPGEAMPSTTCTFPREGACVLLPLSIEALTRLQHPLPRKTLLVRPAADQYLPRPSMFFMNRPRFPVANQRGYQLAAILLAREDHFAKVLGCAMRPLCVQVPGRMRLAIS